MILSSLIDILNFSKSVSISLGGTYLDSSSSVRIFDEDDIDDSNDEGLLLFDDNESFNGNCVDVDVVIDTKADSSANNKTNGFIFGDAGDDDNDNNSLL